MNGFKRVYPSRGAITLDGGLNTKFEVSLLEDNESPSALNVSFVNGSVGTRLGSTKLNTNAVSSKTFNGIYARRANDGISETMCAWAGTDMFTLNTTTFITVPSGQSLFQIGTRIAAENFQNYLFIGQSGTIAQKWDGTALTRHGVYPPTTTCAVASNGVGALTASGQYQYKITYVNTQLVESDVGPVSTTFVISVTSGQNTLSAIPTAPQSFGINARYIYRTLATSVATYYRVGSIADNTTTTFNDNIADSALGVAAPTDNGVPPQYSKIIYHQGRVFTNDITNVNRVWYSALNTPYTFASTNFQRSGDNAADLVRNVDVYDNQIVIDCEKSSWMIYMPDTTVSNWRLIRIKTPFGCKSPYGTFNYNGRRMAPAVQNFKFVGMAAIAGTAVDPSTAIETVFTAGSELKSDRIEPDMFNVQESYQNGISAIVYKNRAFVSLPYGGGQTTNNRIYVWDFSMSNLRKSQEGSWVPWTGMAAEQFVIYGTNLYYCSSVDGFVYQMEVAATYSDNGSAINSYFYTKEFSGIPDEYSLFKDWRWANVLIDNAGAYQMNMGFKVDSDAGSGTFKAVDLTPGTNLWGTILWGFGLWGAGTSTREYRLYLDQSRGKRIQLFFTNQNAVNQRFKVHRITNLNYNVKGLR